MYAMNWKLLGIEPTKDKKTITSAYRTQLAHTNPEDKPEEFKQLRAAYEEAMKLADQTEEEITRDESPVGLWMEQIRTLKVSNELGLWFVAVIKIPLSDTSQTAVF